MGHDVGYAPRHHTGPLRASAQFTPFEATFAQFDAAVATGVLEDAGGAVSLAVFSGSEVIWAKGYGWAYIEGRVAADARTIGRTGSISKSFTAVFGKTHRSVCRAEPKAACASYVYMQNEYT